LAHFRKQRACEALPFSNGAVKKAAAACGDTSNVREPFDESHWG
jgi:hypothetical protein